jgi:glucokinase
MKNIHASEKIDPLFGKTVRINMILAGDIGATNTRLTLFEETHELKKIAEGHFLSKNYKTLLPIIQEFLKQQNNPKITRAGFGIAGPVLNGRCQATNLPWVVDSHELQKTMKVPVHLLNDLESYAWGLKVLSPKDLCVLHPGNPKTAGNEALIAAGTGLGEAGLYFDGREHRPFACEGGHTEFGPRDEIEDELLKFSRKEFGSHVSYERIVSGPGLQHIYRFLIAKGYEKPSPAVQKEMETKDPSVVISEYGRANRDPGCARAVKMFVSLYGAEAGNLALKVMALGGVYVGGNIANKFSEEIKKKNSGFVQAFLDKGRLSEVVKKIAVYLVLNPDCPLLGAAEYARTHH